MYNLLDSRHWTSQIRLLRLVWTTGFNVRVEGRHPKNPSSQLRARQVHSWKLRIHLFAAKETDWTIFPRVVEGLVYACSRGYASLPRRGRRNQGGNTLSYGSNRLKGKE